MSEAEEEWNDTKNDTKRHLGVTNATDITQLVDMRLGWALNVRIGNLQDEWIQYDIAEWKPAFLR